MKFGLKVNPGTWTEARRWADIAQDAGFDSLWTGDNLRNARDPRVPVHDGPAIIAGWAATTARIRIGLLIANMIYRRPTVLAKQAVTMDHISDGRFELGVGSGLWPADHAMAGVPVWSAQERADRFAEFVATVDRLRSGDAQDHAGGHYPYEGAALSPAPIQRRIPLIVAANGPRALAVAADHADSWVTFTGTAEEQDFHEATLTRIRTLDQRTADRGRPPVRKVLLAYGSISPWSSADAFSRLVDRYRAIGFDEIICYAPKPAERAVFDKVARRLTDLQ
ncbi:LLM class flavin-dependent oxidoreductase [Actinomadura rubrisoli]|uniref:LLM class flavin-dependent oxidoreductase n=1 Tax=Actinomadura rubrisoli TaxID=2530368 RepID=A0A4R5BNW3_9ACTN|nr:LLM class flavin-dependent oxidoreductase [Actinomadura rubrisoli]TDD87116.1 LLM class flavin-dependent oxidoreductase [Actinomadura rubrisoli]